MEPNKELEQIVEIKKKKTIFQRAKQCASGAWLSVESASRKAWKGAAAGAFIIIGLFAALFGIGLETGLGSTVDFVIVFIPVVLAASISPFLIYPVILLFKRINNRFLAVILSSAILMIILLSQVRSTHQILPLSFVLVGYGVVAGGAVGFWLNSKRRKFSSLLVLTLGMLTIAGFAFWLIAPGFNRFPTAENPVVPKPLQVGNPSQKGVYEVRTFTYGSGTDKRRPQFAEGVEYRTDTVNASFVTGGWDKYRTWFWGFDRAEIPLNGTVWMPEGNGEFPLVLMVHGNHIMEEFSDEGYAYLGELLASRGYIAVSVDENFLNTSSWSGSLNNEISTRAWLMLKHLNQFEEFNEIKNMPLHNKVDFDNIALLGHSRGGQAVAVATEFNKLDRYPNNGIVTFNFDYKIKSIIAIAPTDYFTLSDKPVEMENVNYLLLHGSYDSDVSEFSGDRQYNDLTFTDENDWMKTSLYIHGANHGQFNTVWGDNDTTLPMNLFINKKPLLEGEEQRQIAKTYISAFLDATLKEKTEYKPLFQDYSYALQWLPDTIYVNRYSDNDFRVINDYENDYDLTTGNDSDITFKASRLKYWSEGELESREGNERKNHGVYLKWDESYSNSGLYQLTLPDGYFQKAGINEADSLTFSAASIEEVEEAADFTVRLKMNNGQSAEVSLSETLPLAPALHIQHTKTWFYQKSRYGNTHEPVLQTFHIPIAKFTAQGLDINRVNKIEFVFDKTDQGKIFLDEIGVLKAIH
ncbi:poly(ethylene terephthalate) hydrolase family protein [Bacillus sp. SG-1]|uniref:poly(ethylene terephthalate) hydrolase family protein n=1 Tax=Bacillus sp. SG-1 TaxID=161544 RepID=UPI0001543F1B|nr:putative secreted protein [Bacillus sp. SG-1]EDL66201.1 putative secreted protein [Bacillus sp. SG-1]